MSEAQTIAQNNIVSDSSEDHIRRNETIEIIKTNNLEKQINQVMVTAYYLNQYYQVDHTIADLPQWKITASKLAQISELIETQRRKLEMLENSNKKTKLLNKLSIQRNKITRYTPIYFDALLDALEDSIKQKDPSTEMMDSLRTDPWAVVYFKLHQKKQEKFATLYQKGIEQLGTDIVEHDRLLFVKIPKSEILNLKSEQCPHYLAFIKYFKHIIAFVQSEIVASSSVAKRTAIMERWVLIARECFNRGDFSSMLAIHKALTGNSIVRMKATNQGLSIAAKKILDENNKFLMKRATRNLINVKQENRDNPHIPYIETYHVTLEKIEHTLPEGKTLLESPVANSIVDRLLIIQTANKTISKKPGDTLLYMKLNNITCETNFENDIYQRSLNRVPNNITLQPTPLFNETLHSTLSLLKNKMLVKIALKEKIIFDSRLSTDQIKIINNSTAAPISNRRFSRLLKNINLHLTRKQIKQVNSENHQMYCRNLIENAALQKISENHTIQSTKWYKSTEKQIFAINKALRHTVNSDKLNTMLKNIGIAVSKTQTIQFLTDASPSLQ